MKKSLVALALFGAFTATAQAQSSVQIYGTIDAGLGKASNGTTSVTKRDNNKLWTWVSFWFCLIIKVI